MSSCSVPIEGSTRSLVPPPTVYAPAVAETTPAPALARVPFADLSLPADLEREILADIADLVSRGEFTNGPEVEEFERAFARYVGADHCVGVASGLDALRLGLLAAGIESGDEVIVPAHTFAATLEAVLQAGGRPILVDVDETDFNIDADDVAAAVTSRTRFILPVHLYGQLADVAALLRTAERHKLALVEDACQAHGATRDGFRAGATGAVGAFSFYPTKNLGAFGDAGALVTGSSDIAARARALREHGERQKYEHEYPGYTARLDTIQAAVLLRKLPLLDRRNDERRTAARFYTESLNGAGDLRLPAEHGGSDHVWHLYVVRTSERDGLASFLHDRGIGTGRHYPHPLHLAPAYSHLGFRPGAFPIAERIAAEVLSLPLFPGISEEQQTAVVTAVREFFDRG